MRAPQRFYDIAKALDPARLMMDQDGGQWFHGLFMPPQKVRGGSPGSLSAEHLPLMAARS